jgi:predicted pyridoxine 5'-phosphate oxidase superfamily flavin-nucleotide-binding protein
MEREVMEVFNNEKAIKVLATIDNEGKLNCVPIGSLSAIDGDTLGFAELFIGKTKENLTATKRVSAFALVVSPVPGTVPRGFQAKGTFQEFQTEGAVFDAFKERVKKQLNMDIKGVGLIKVEESWGIIPGLGHQIS